MYGVLVQVGSGRNKWLKISGWFQPISTLFFPVACPYINLLFPTSSYLYQMPQQAQYCCEVADFNQSLPFSSQLLVRILIYFFLRPVICIKCRNKHNTAVKEMPWVVVFTTAQVVNTVVMNTTFQVVFITAKIAFIFTSFSAVHIYNFSIFHSRLFTTSRVYFEPTWWSATGWLVSSVGKALHRYRRGHGFKSPYRPEFFQALFSLLLK